MANVSGVEADLRFHRGILAACGNALLLQMGNPIGVGLTISHRFSNEALHLPPNTARFSMGFGAETRTQRGERCTSC